MVDAAATAALAVQQGSAPLVTVVVPMLNEERFIAQCLQAVSDGGYSPEEMEVLVVDGGSDDGSRDIVLELAKSASNLHLLENRGRRPASAINLAIRNARGRYIVRMDAHSQYPSGYVRASVEELERSGADNVGGTWHVVPGGNGYLAGALALTVQHRFGVGNTAYRLGGSGDVDTVPFGAFRRELFQRLGTFDETLEVHEDFEFNARIRRSGGRVHLSDRINSTYHHPSTVGAFLRKAFRYGYWSTVCWLRHPYTFLLRRCAPLFLVAALLSLGVAAIWYSRAGWLLLAIAALYAVLACAASLQLAHRQGWRYLAVLPILFLARHLTYGFGMLAGCAGGLLGPGSAALNEESGSQAAPEKQRVPPVS